MERFAFAVFYALGSLLSSGCQPLQKPAPQIAATASSQPAAVESEAPLPSSTLVGPQPVPVAGSYLHRGSGLSYPTAAAGATRYEVIQFDREGMDVSANYEIKSSSGPIAFSVYLYPVTGAVPEITPAAARDPKVCRQIFARTLLTVQGLFVEPHIIETGEMLSPINDKMGYRALFEAESSRHTNGFQSIRGPIRSELYLFCDIDTSWLLKYRFSYPAGIDVKATIAEFIKAVPQL